jgi:DNA modification methylase
MNLPVNQIIQGDCLEVMKQWPDKCVDVVITDPPYGIDFQSARRSEKSAWKPKIANDTEPFVAWIPDASRILKDGGRLICFCRWDVKEVFMSAIRDAGLVVKSQIIWDKVIHGMGDLQGEFAPQHEIALYATKGRYVFTGKRPKTIMQHQRVSPEALVHPNEKPISLMREIIKSITDSKDIVVDCFAGSGSTCMAAEQLRRKFIGIELSPDYCDIARKRVKEAQEQFALLELK